MNHPEAAYNRRLVDYLLLVGPSHSSVTFEPVAPPNGGTGGGGRGSSRGAKNAGPPLQNWHNITTPTPTILRRFPPEDRPKNELITDVVYFCQPEGCCIELTKPKCHIFMLTDTETNDRTYGVCLTIPHLFDPQTSNEAPSSSKSGGDDLSSINIQEWGVLSLCILSHHPFFNFFAKCLKTLVHFMEHFGAKEQSWNELIHAAKSDSGSKTENSTAGVKAKSSEAWKSTFVTEIEDWIGNLLDLPAPEIGRCGLEVELEVEPEVFVCYPPKNRLPFCDLHLHRMFQKVGVHTTIEIFKLVLSEQKVSLYSMPFDSGNPLIRTLPPLLGTLPPFLGTLPPSLLRPLSVPTCLLSLSFCVVSGDPAF